MEIKAAGYEVHILTCENHVQLVNEAGLNCVGCFMDCEYELLNNEMLVKSQADGDTMTFLKAMADIWEKSAERHFKEWTAAVEDIKPDLIVKGTLTEYLACFAELHFKIPVVQTMLSVIPPNCAHMIFGFPNLPCGLNNFMVRKLLVEQGILDQCQFSDPIAQKKYGVKLQGELLHLRWYWDLLAN